MTQKILVFRILPVKDGEVPTHESREIVAPSREKGQAKLLERIKKEFKEYKVVHIESVDEI